MTDDPLEQLGLTPKQQRYWLADIAALRGHRRDQGQFPLRLGDLFNEMKVRWGEKMPVLARQAGVPYHAARQRACVAEAIPPGSPLRATGLPYSILCLLAPLAEKERWAEQARVLQEAGRLKVREFARMLEEAGVRQRRDRKAPRCLHCGREVAETPERLFLRSSERAGWLCGSACVLAYLGAPPAGTGQHPGPGAATTPPAPNATARRPGLHEAAIFPGPDETPIAPAADAPPSPVGAGRRPGPNETAIHPGPDAATTQPDPNAAVRRPGPRTADRDSDSQWFRCRFGPGMWKRRPLRHIPCPPGVAAHRPVARSRPAPGAVRPRPTNERRYRRRSPGRAPPRKPEPARPPAGVRTQSAGRVYGPATR